MPVEHTKSERGFMDKVIRPDGRWDWPQFFRELNNILNGLVLAFKRGEGFKMWQYDNGFYESKKPEPAASTSSAPDKKQPSEEPETLNIPHLIEERSQEARNEFNRAADQAPNIPAIEDPAPANNPSAPAPGR